MKACIFVDGENFRYSIKDLFGSYDYLPTCNWAGLFDSIATDAYNAERLRVYWYTVPKVIFRPDALFDSDKFKTRNDGVRVNALEEVVRKYGSPEQIADIQNTCRHLCERQKVMQARFDGWKKQEDGIALSNEGIEFRRAGTVKFNLLRECFENEKEIDVKLAVDLLELRDIYDVAILISGDQDFVPAIKVVKDSGKRVVNVNFRKRSGTVLSGGAYALNVFADKTLNLPYARLRQWFEPPRS